MKTIVFAGSSRTGKTSAINLLEKKLLELNPNARIKIYDEMAIKYIKQQDWEEVNTYELEKYVIWQDKIRLENLQEYKKNNEYDYVLIDRTFVDSVVYVYWHILLGKTTNADILSDLYEYMDLSRQVYDLVISFYQPMKKDELLTFLNNHNLDMLFRYTMQYFYADKVVSLPNMIEFQKDIDKYVNIINNKSV